MTAKTLARAADAFATHRTPPHNFEVEMAVLGMILTDNRTHKRVADILRPKHFADPAHGRLYGACAQLIEAGRTADPFTLQEALGSDLSEIGGNQYLVKLADVGGLLVNAEDYARTIHNRWLQRRAIEIGETMADDAYHVRLDRSVGDLIAKVQAELTTLSAQTDASDGYSARCLADIEPEALAWLWPGRIPMGKITIIAGDPGLGKSLVTLDLAARVSTGADWPDGAPNAAGKAVILSAEDDPGDTIRPRLDAAEADVRHLHMFDGVVEGGVERPVTLGDVDALDRLLRDLGGVRLVVVDPISAFITGRTDTHRNSDVRALLRPLADLAARHRVAIVGITHLAKTGGSAIYRPIGSIAFVAAARAAWAVARDPENEARRLFLPIKQNLEADHGGLAFRIEAASDVPRVAWESGAVFVAVDDALSPPQPDGEHSERDEAAHWIEETLADGPVPVENLRRAARLAGLSWATLRRAKSTLGVKALKVGFGKGAHWVWHLRVGEDAHERVEDAHAQSMSPLASSEHLRDQDGERDEEEL